MKDEIEGENVRLISTGPIQRLGRALTRVLIRDVQPKYGWWAPSRRTITAKGVLQHGQHHLWLRPVWGTGLGEVVPL